MKFLKNLSKKDLAGKKVLVRVDFNVPIRRGQVVESMRIDLTLPTIKFLTKKKARVILVSHLGKDGSASLRPVVRYLAAKKIAIKLVSNPVAAAKSKAPVILLENIRRFTGEEANNLHFAKQLASLADLYVNDAFSVSHREHASIVGVPKLLPAYAGLLLEKEIVYLRRVLGSAKPLLLVLGGVKFSTKFPLLKKFLSKADTVCVGGALANTLLKARGEEVGVSVVDEINNEIKTLAKNNRIVLPLDFVVAGRQKGVLAVKKLGELSASDKIVDLGPLSAKLFIEKIKNAKTILWNGPLGLVDEGFIHGTAALARNLPKSAFSVLGGGDSVEALRVARLLKKPTFISTGGGAMLDFLVDGTLPGIRMLG